MERRDIERSGGGLHDGACDSCEGVIELKFYCFVHGVARYRPSHTLMKQHSVEELQSQHSHHDNETKHEDEDTDDSLQ